MSEESDQGWSLATSRDRITSPPLTHPLPPPSPLFSLSSPLFSPPHSRPSPNINPTIPHSHSFRIEHKLGPRLKVVALIDPSIARAEAVLAGKRASFVESAYRDTIVYKSIEDFHEAMKGMPEKEPK